MTLASIPTVLQALRAGGPVIVADDEGHENEGDAVIAAQLATAETVAWVVAHTSGLIRAPMTNAIIAAMVTALRLSEVRAPR